MNIYKIINFDEETLVKFEEDEEMKEFPSTEENMLSFELNRLDVMRKAYSYGILNRYILKNKELIYWFNNDENNGKFIKVAEEEIKKEDRIMTVNLLLQGDTGFYEGKISNVYNEIENINSFGIESLNNIIFKDKINMKKTIVGLILIFLGAIGGIFFNKYIMPASVILIILGFLSDSKIRESKRIKRFIDFNQARMDFWKKCREEEIGKESVQVNYSVKGNRGYIETIEP